MDRLSRRAVIAALAAALVFAVAPGVAQAAEVDKIEETSITAPADPTFVLLNAGAKLTVSGSVLHAKDRKEGVNIACYWETSAGVTESVVLAEAVHVDYTKTTPISGTFSIPVSLPAPAFTSEPEPIACRLRAVPQEELFTPEPSTLAPFSGPRLGAAGFTPVTVAEGPNKGRVVNFEAFSAQLGGYGAYESFGYNGVIAGVPENPITSAEGRNLFVANDTFEAPGLQVDGISAFAPGDAATLFSKSANLSGLPELNASEDYNTTNGDLTIHESEELVKCAPEAAVYPPTATSCTSFVPTGVSLQRTIVQEQAGEHATVSDTYLSTDGLAHTLNLTSLEEAEETSARYNFPWVDGATYKEHKAGEVIPGPGGPANVFVSFNGEADGSAKGAQGAITFASAPSKLAFAETGGLGTLLTASFERSIPAGGSTTLEQSFSWAFTEAQARTLAGGPVVSIASPVNGATIFTPAVTVTGSVVSLGNGLPATISVNGQSVPVAENGQWSTSVPLSVGANTVTAKATDSLGDSHSAQIEVSYVLPPTVVTSPASSVTQTTATLNGSVNPNGGLVEECTIEYGESPSYGQSASCSSAPGRGLSPEAVSAAASSLKPSTTYDFRVVAKNAAGTTKGNNETFKTEAPVAPTVITGSPSSVTQTTATLDGSVNPNGSEVTECTFEYGATTSYGANAQCSAAPGSASSAVTVSASITGLSPGTTYHFRISARNGIGTSYGGDQTFSTVVAPTPPLGSGVPETGVLPSQTQKPPTASASITKSSFNGHELLVTIACVAGGANCSGELNAVAKVSVKQGHKTRVEQITVAKGSFSLPAGSSETVKLKLTRTATKELTRLGKLATTITAMLAEPNHTPKALTTRLTLHKPHKH
jgi:hypothetical protein